MKLLAEFLGESPGMIAVRATVERLLRLDAGGARRLPPILILGETGTGKGLLAQALHRAGPRRDGAFVDLNCAAIPEHLLEAEMFGFERGAFTDARQAKPGLLQAAHRGTVFLDEVGLLSPALQPKLLKAIEEHTVRRLGGTRSEPADAWVMSATSADLRAAMREGRFREDLYHRLAVVTIELPPLRDRGEDILLLAEHFLDRVCVDYGLAAKRLTADARAAILAHRWPGNVRELTNVMERAVLLTDATAIDASALAVPGAAAERPADRDQASPATLSDVVATVERRHLLAALEGHGWNITRTARHLGISRDTLRYRIEKHGLRPTDTAVRRRSTRARAPAVAPPDADSADVMHRHQLALLRVAVVPDGAESYGHGRALIDRLGEKVQSFGGRVEDANVAGLVALFGIDVVEDAARRAANAALAMIRLAAGSGTRLCAAICGGDFPVLRAGEATRIEPDARHREEAALDLMCRAADAGVVLVNDDARRLLERRFSFVDVGGLGGVRGSIWRLTGAERSGLEVGGRMSAFVGRSNEIEALRRRFAVASEGHGQVVGIVGEAGIGKSRLLDELRRSLQPAAPAWLHGYCLSHGSGTPYLPLLDAVRQQFGLGDTDAVGTAVNRVHAVSSALGLDPEALAPWLLRLLDVDAVDGQHAAPSPEAVKARTFEALTRTWLARSRREPLVLVIEDVHWIDRTSADWLSSFVEAIAGARVLVLVTYRPGYRAPWIEKSYATQLALGPLAPGESRILVQSLTNEASSDVTSTIVSMAGGNPLFLEELARGVPRDRSVSAVPDTIEAILRVRIASLPEQTQRFLETAAVLGPRVPLAVLRAVWEGEGDAEVYLRELARLEFIHEDHEHGEPKHVFRHVLVQEVACAGLADDRRRYLHTRAAQAIASAYAARIDEVVDRLAYHYGQAEEPDKAADYLGRGAARAARAYAHVEAAIALDEAIRQMERSQRPDRDRRLLELLLARVSSLTFLGRFTEIIAVLEQHREQLERVGDPAITGAWHFWLGHTRSLLGDPAGTVACARAALAEAARCADESTTGRALFLLAYECFWSGRPREGIEHGRRAIEHLERAGDRWWHGHTWWVIALNLGIAGELEAAADAGARCQAIGESLEDSRLRASGAWVRGAFLALAGDLDTAVAAARDGLAWTHDPVDAAVARGILGGVHLEKGEAFEAIPLLTSASEDCARFGVRQTAGWFKTLLGEAWLARGDTERARAFAGDGLHVTEAIGYRYGVGWAQRALGRIAVASGDLVDAKEHLGRALRTFIAIEARYEVARTHLDLARLARARQDQDAFKTHLDTAIRLFETLRLPRLLDRARELGATLLT